MTGFFEGSTNPATEVTPHRIDEHRDANAATPSDGDILRYEADTETWDAVAFPNVGQYDADVLRLPAGTSGSVSREVAAPTPLGFFRWDAAGEAVEYTGSPGVVTNPLAIGVVSDMVSDISLILGDIVETLGYYTAGDGGANRYQIVAGSTGTPDGGLYINLTNGLQAKGLFNDGYINVTQFGVKADGVTDNSNMLDAAFAAFTNGVTFHFPPGDIGISRTLTIGDGTATNVSTVHQGAVFKGSGQRFALYSGFVDTNPGVTRLKWIGAVGPGPMLSMNGPISLTWDGISLFGDYKVEECWHQYHNWFSTFKDMQVKGYTVRGHFLTAYHDAREGGNLVSSGASSNIYQSVRWDSFGDTLAKVCVQVGDDEIKDKSTNFNHDVNQTTFYNCTAVVNGNGGSMGMVWRFADACNLNKTFLFAPAATSGVGTPTALVIHTPEVFDEVSRSFPANISIFNSTISNEAVLPNLAGKTWLGGTLGGGGFQYTAYSSERRATSPRYPQIEGLRGFSGRGAYFGHLQIPIEDINASNLDRDNVQQLWTPTVIFREFISNPITVNTAALTSIYSCRLDPNLLRSVATDFIAGDYVLVDRWDRSLKLETRGSLKNDTGVDQTFLIGLYLDGTPLQTNTLTIPTSAFFRPVDVVWEMHCRDNNSSLQKIHCLVNIGDGFDNNPTSVEFGYIDVADGSFDATSGGTLSVRVQHGAASAVMSYNPTGFIATLN